MSWHCALNAKRAGGWEVSTRREGSAMGIGFDSQWLYPVSVSSARRISLFVG